MLDHVLSSDGSSSRVKTFLTRLKPGHGQGLGSPVGWVGSWIDFAYV